jgi:AbrB family looped-hinge helix DNA binding protein
MVTASAKVTSKGQITIPAEIRQALSVAPGDRVSFSLEDGVVRVERERSWVERTAGMFKGRGPKVPPTARELREMAEIAIVEDVMRRMGD